MEDAVFTGAAADSVDCDERLKGLARLLRYAMLITDGSQHVIEQLIAEIHELCPQLRRSLGQRIGAGGRLDHRAVAQDQWSAEGVATASVSGDHHLDSYLCEVVS